MASRTADSRHGSMHGIPEQYWGGQHTLSLTMKSFGHSLPLIADYKSSWASQRYSVSGIKSWVCACLRGYVNCIIFVWVFPLLLDTVSCLKAVINTDMIIMKNMSGNEQRKLFFVRKVALMDTNYV